MEVSLLASDGKNAGKMNLSDEIFSVKPNKQIVHSALVWYLNSKRSGNHSAMTRTEVAGSGKKPWKQKGTGRARSGSAQSPLWRGGGVIFPPKPRDYSFSMPKKARKLALKVVLSDRAKFGRIKLVDALKADTPKTKKMAGILKTIGAEGKVLIISELLDKNLQLSARNIKGVKLTRPSELNIHDLLNSEWVVIEKTAANKLEEVLA